MQTQTAQSRPTIDRTNEYPLSTVPTATYSWGLFVAVSSDRSDWRANFFFRTQADAKKHARRAGFRSSAVGKAFP